jgi:hypothetical protein
MQIAAQVMGHMDQDTGPAGALAETAISDGASDKSNCIFAISLTAILTMPRVRLGKFAGLSST